MIAQPHNPASIRASFQPDTAQQLLRAIHDEAGLYETLICYQELSTLIACADDLNPKTLWILLDAINRQFDRCLNGIQQIVRS